MYVTDVPGHHAEQERSLGVRTLAGDEDICSDEKSSVIAPCAATCE